MISIQQIIYTNYLFTKSIKILSYLSKMDNSQSDIGLVYNKRLLETGTSNLLFVKDQKFFTPRKGYYEGNTYKFFKTKIKKIIKKDIFLKEINSYDEILLLGSGKGVTSVKTINEIKWKRKNLDKFCIIIRNNKIIKILNGLFILIPPVRPYLLVQTFDEGLNYIKSDIIVI